jgi:hypothetical protein
MHRSFRRALPALAIALLAGTPVLAGCNMGRPAESPSPVTAATLRVENQGFADMNIYLLLSGGSRQRLGTATGNSVSHFNLPRTAVAFGTVRFIADPIGGRRAPVSEEISVHAGDEVVLTIPPY